jgi:putative sterol carrier protein
MATYQFLSDEWWAAFDELRDEYADRLPAPPVQMRMNQVVTDHPFGDDDLHFHTATTETDTEWGKEHIDDADVTVTTDYETARSVIVDQDQQAVMQSFMNGKIKVQGDMSKMMMANATPPTELAQELAGKLKAITA